MKAIKIICMCLSFCICFLSFCSCSANENALTVNSTPVNKEIFGYYLSVAVNSSKYNNSDNKQDIAGRLCAQYIAGLKMIDKYSLELTAEEKVVVSSELKINWQMYSSFYEKYSVSKQTLCKILEYESLINSLVENIYSSSGERALADGEIKAFFNENYIAANTAYTDFNELMTEDEIQSITEKYTAMANLIRGGGEFSSAVQQYPDLVEYEDTLHIISSFDSSYPGGLFDKISESKEGSTQVLRYESGIYLIQKEDASEYFDIYKSDCIVKMKKEQVLEEISSAAGDYTVKFNKNVISKIMSKAEV